MLEAFGFEPAPSWVGRVARAALSARAVGERPLPRRRRSKLLRPGGARSYPSYPLGHTPEALGATEPPADIDPALLRRRTRTR
jgi:hypothetical protein